MKAMNSDKPPCETTDAGCPWAGDKDHSCSDCRRDAEAEEAEDEVES